MVPATSRSGTGGCMHSQRKPTHKFCNECGVLLPSASGVSFGGSTPLARAGVGGATGAAGGAAPPYRRPPAAAAPPPAATTRPGVAPRPQFNTPTSLPESRARAATGPSFAIQQQPSHSFQRTPPAPSRTPGQGRFPAATTAAATPSLAPPGRVTGFNRTLAGAHSPPSPAASSPASSSLARSSPAAAGNARAGQGSSPGWSATSLSQSSQAAPAIPVRARPIVANTYNNGGSASAPASTYYGGSPSSGLFGSSSPDQRYISGPQPSNRPGESEMTKEERDLQRVLREVEREKEKVLQEERLKQREKEFEKEEEQYTKEKQREYIQKLKEGKLDLGQRESVYVHQKKDAPVLTLQLLDETLIEKHNGQTYTLYKVRVTWADCVWTIQRRYSQFSDFHKSVKWKTNVKLPYPLPGKKFMGSLEDDVVEQRKVGLRQYLKGVEERQMELVNNDKYEQLFIRFVGPFQLGDTKDHVPNKLPFKVKL